MTLFQATKRFGKIAAKSFVSVLGSDGGTFIVESQGTHIVQYVPKRVFDTNFARIC